MFNARPRSLLYLFLFISVVNSLHFYLDNNEKRCFIEELPTDTVVEGKHHALAPYIPFFLNRPSSISQVTITR
jgi:hypothetical protein